MTVPPPRAHRTASKLAQLLGDTIAHHAPVTAQINAAASRAAVDDWLEGLEAHLAQFVRPFLANVLENTEPPEPVRALLAEAIDPQAQFTSTIESIFLWGIVSSIVSTSVSPFLVGIQNDLSAAAVGQGIARPPDLSTLATAAGRGLAYGSPPTVTVPDATYQLAAQLGIDANYMNLAASIIGLPPALQELFEMYRRGIITIDQVEQGLREGDFRDDWIQYAIQLIHAWLTPIDFVRAAVQAQMSYSDAQQWAAATGLDTSTPVPIDTTGTEATPDMFGLAFSIAGRPPGPAELGRMANRGIIPWTGTGAGQTTFEQGIAESDVKTKWTPALQQLTQYIPPPREIGTLLERGAIDADQAQSLWEQNGVPSWLAAGYVYMTEQQHVSQDKLLAKGEITTGYFDGIFTNAQATEMLGLLGYRDDVAADILAVIDFRREIQAINMVIRKIGTLYIAFKLTATEAQQALQAVGVASDQAASLLETWSLLQVEPVRVPSADEIGKAVEYGTLTQAQALSKLEILGYEPEDAAIVLSAYSEAQVPLPPGPYGAVV